MFCLKREREKKDINIFLIFKANTNCVAVSFHVASCHITVGWT